MLKEKRMIDNTIIHKIIRKWLAIKKKCINKQNSQILKDFKKHKRKVDLKGEKFTKSDKSLNFDFG